MTSQICARCDKLTNQSVIVGQVHSASCGGRTAYTCPSCTPKFPKPWDPFAELAALRRARERGPGMSATTGHARACYCCRKTGSGLRRQYLPAPSGPGWIRYACTACAALPADPELIPAGVAQVLALRVARMRRAS